jgi:hypothetical protein
MKKKVSECPFRKAVEYTGFLGEKVVLHDCGVGEACNWDDDDPLEKCYRYKLKKEASG